MDQIDVSELSPYRRFTRDEWASLRADEPMLLREDEIAALQSLNDRLSLEEVETIYLPLSRLLSMYVAATQGLFKATRRFLGSDGAKVPFVIGVAGSVAVGKSTTSRVLRALLSRWPNTPKVDLITTDGFLLPNAVLEAEGLMNRKGFPESYDVRTLLGFLSDVKAGREHVEAPVYSHLVYDVVPGETVSVDRPDILIVEGLNVLQARQPSPAEADRATPFVSDFFDFSVYIDADEETLSRWYVQRFMRLRETAFQDPNSFFHRYSKLTDREAVATAQHIWNGINLPNLRGNIRPTRVRADLILTKSGDHRIEQVDLRKV
ncbi:MAG: type I pantothenate kinase [Devosiaceae bacterium]|nr:type I pantothenate kinase [Devosiaceae bacterium MH13]